MKYDLKTPCKNCPFRTDGTRITFACRERAEEIADSAYRNGFPCHLSAAFAEDEDTINGESGGFYATEETQHCIGFIIMKMKEGMDTCWPGIDNDDDLLERIFDRVDWDAPVFESEDDFIEANSSR